MRNAIQENPTLTLAVNGMNCRSCVDKVQRSLAAVTGVADAVVDLKANNATIRYDPVSVGIEDLKAAVTSAGYTIAENRVQFSEYRWWIISPAIGLGIQVTLYTLFRAHLHGFKPDHFRNTVEIAKKAKRQRTSFFTLRNNETLEW